MLPVCVTLPLQRTTGSTHKTQPIANTCGSSAPYKRNLGGVINAFNPNLSQFRPRGWGVGNGLKGGSAPHEELYYTQPGYPLDKRNPTRHISRGGRVGFTLTDTPASLAAKQAVRFGMSPAEHAKYSDPAPSVTQVLALAESSAVEKGDAAAQTMIDGLVSAQPELAAYDLPVEAGKRRLATYLALGKGHARSWGKDVEAGTFAAAVHEVLTPEEEAFLDASGGVTAEDLLLDVQKYQGMIDAYAGVTNNKVRAGGWARCAGGRPGGGERRACAPRAHCVIVVLAAVRHAAGGRGGRGARDGEAGRRPGAAQHAGCHQREAGRPERQVRRQGGGEPKGRGRRRRTTAHGIEQ